MGDWEKEMVWRRMVERLRVGGGREEKVKRWSVKKMGEEFERLKGDV